MTGRAEYAVPSRITIALDAKGLDGPEVDAACGVAEPTVDLWEAGVLLPQRWQVGRLAKLTGMPAEFFYELEPLPSGRMFICSRRKEYRSVVEPGELGNPVCADCGSMCWHAVPDRDGATVLLERPDPAYGSLLMCVLGRTGRGPSRRLLWGVRPASPGDGARHLLRRPHQCPTWTRVCEAPGPDGRGECGELAKVYPGGVFCAGHLPGAGGGGGRFAGATDCRLAR